MSVHLLTILQARDITLAAAVALGALVGPSQVGARFIEMLIGRYHHPIWTKVASVMLRRDRARPAVGPPAGHCADAGVLRRRHRPRIDRPRHAAAWRCSAPRTTRRSWAGSRVPSLIAQAAAPSIGAYLIVWLGADGALATVVAVACVNVLLVLCLFAAQRKASR